MWPGSLWPGFVWASPRVSLTRVINFRKIRCFSFRFSGIFKIAGFSGICFTALAPFLPIKLKGQIFRPYCNQTTVTYTISRKKINTGFSFASYDSKKVFLLELLQYTLNRGGTAGGQSSYSFTTRPCAIGSTGKSLKCNKDEFFMRGKVAFQDGILYNCDRIFCQVVL